MMRPAVKRTYARLSTTTRAIPFPPSSPRSEYSSDKPEESSSSPIKKRKRDASQFSALFSKTNTPAPPPTKKSKIQSDSSSTRTKTTTRFDTDSTTTATTKKTSRLKQLHLTLASTAVRHCDSCGLSYTRGSPDDEELHRMYCLRVSKGSEWGREEVRAEGKEVEVIEKDIPLKKGKERGRIVSFRADVTGKLGSKLATILETVNFTLSAPDLPPHVLSRSKAYFFLIPIPGTNPTREKIAGCLIAQHIETAMEIVDLKSQSNPSLQLSVDVESLVRVQDPMETSQGEGGLYCRPTLLPTPLGIPRIFTSSSYRHKGIAQHLLNAAVCTFIHGCVLEASKGQVAFSQPTGAGRGLMENWGGGKVRIYQE